MQASQQKKDALLGMIRTMADQLKNRLEAAVDELLLPLKALALTPPSPCSADAIAWHCDLDDNAAVWLNVGGGKFAASLSTLTAVPGSMLAAMFSGRHSTAKDSEGCVFVDRDPDHFTTVL